MHSKKITISGQVQGVGFRPFIYNLAATHRLDGWVRNDVGQGLAQGAQVGLDPAIEGRAPGLDRHSLLLPADRVLTGVCHATRRTDVRSSW